MKSKVNIPRSMSAVALHMVGKARTSGGWRVIMVITAAIS